MKKTFEPDDLEALSTVVDEAHHHSTGELFEWAAKVSKLKDDHPFEELRELVTPHEVDDILRVLAWTGKVFEAMRAVDYIRRNGVRP